MRKVRQLIGLPVVELTSGKRVAVIRSLLIDPVTCRLVALVLQKSGLLSDGKAVELERVHAIGDAAVILPESVEPVSTGSLLERWPQAVTEDRLAGRQVLTDSGRMLGTLADLVFDPATGRVEQLVLSDGLLQDLIGGYSTIPAPGQAVVGDDHIIVPEAASVGAAPDSLVMSAESPRER